MKVENPIINDDMSRKMKYLKFIQYTILISFVGCFGQKVTNKEQKHITNGVSSKGRLTLENYLKVKNGMSKKDVIKILGETYEVVGSITTDNFSTLHLRWKDEDAKVCNITFTNQKVDSIHQSGLDSPTTTSD
ncbi:MAG: hypothetical protein NE328_07710 [Lentisphaeraceae bacterium]|nr:hypothetical protein [Lentisphaeraceae bacterium]